MQLLFPIVMSSMLVTAALALYWITRNSIGRYLFEAPAWVVRERFGSRPEASVPLPASEQARDLSQAAR